VSQLNAAASGSGEDETNLENRVADKNKKNEKLRGKNLILTLVLRIIYHQFRDLLIN
jgi:hypothetical protein